MKLEPLAIVGIGCRFPGGAENPEKLWQLLCEGFDGIIDVPADRWDIRRFYDPDPNKPRKMCFRRAGFLRERIDAFDASFFNISPREAERMDPQQYLLLENAWEALEDAEILSDSLKESNTGVFIGSFALDRLLIEMSPLNFSILNTGNLGVLATTLAARISFFFDLRGPCVVMDTACSSSLVAFHYACQSIWNDECKQAFAGGANIIVAPEFSVGISQGHFLSPREQCRPFDSDAEGYVRGEGAGMVFIKKLADALKDKNPIYALVRGTGINQDGRTAALPIPSQQSQYALIQEVQKRAQVLPEQIQYVEAHGTGTAVGDPIEAGALEAALNPLGRRTDICYMGSIKSNIGHLEAAAGIAGLIKAALCLKHRKIPPNLHFDNPNPAIPFDTYCLKVPKEVVEFSSPSKVLFAAINSFGFGGTNAHVILEESAKEMPPIKERQRHCWQREVFWHEAVESKQNRCGKIGNHPILNRPCRAPEPAWQVELNLYFFDFLENHSIEGTPIIPGAFYVEAGLAVHQEQTQTVPCSLQHIHFHEPLLFSNEEPLLYTCYTPNDHTYRVFSDVQGDNPNWKLHASGQIYEKPVHNPPEIPNIDEIRRRCTKMYKREEIYQTFASWGMSYKGSYRGIQELWLGEDEALVKIEHSPDKQFLIHPATLDSIFQTMLMYLGKLLVIESIDQIHFYKSPEAIPLWCYGIAHHPVNEVPFVELLAWDEEGICVQVVNIRTKFLRPEDTIKQLEQKCFYEFRWSSVEVVEGKVPTSPIIWLSKNTLPQEYFQKQIGPSETKEIFAAYLCTQEMPDIIQQENHSALQLLQFVQQLIQEYGNSAPIYLSVVTRGTQSVSQFGGTIQLGFASLWGLVRVIRNEFANIFTRLIDLDTTEEIPPDLLAKILFHSGEVDEIAFRKGQLFAHEINRVSFPMSTAETSLFHPDACYLITGGFSGLGLAIAEWMVDQGIKHLVLVGRSETSYQGAKDAIEKMQTGGVAVQTYVVDVTKKDQLKTVFVKIKKEMPGLKGVIHAAGTLDDRFILDQNPTSFRIPMDPKVLGSWNLHELTKDMGLDFFVLFSSISSMIGNPGQANYAAANSFLDCLCTYRRQQGLPAITINWGAIQDIGMAARNPAVLDHFAKIGLKAFSKKQFLALFERVLQVAPTQVAVIDMDFNQWAKYNPGVLKSRLFSPLLEKKKDNEPIHKNEAPEYIENVIKGILADILHMKPDKIATDISISTLGIDSLMAMELRTALELKFGVSISTVKIMAGPTIQALAKDIADHLGNKGMMM